MIITKLQGGLGNQMFQYAAARAMADRIGGEVFVDADWFNSQHSDTVRRYELGIFGIQPRQLPWWMRYVVIRNRLYPLIREPKNLSLCDKLMTNTKMNVSMLGYWQSEKYFIRDTENIRKQFSFPKRSSSSIKRFVRQIQETNAVSVHIRRGDYAKNAKTRAFHGLLALSYYQRSINYITSRMNKPVFYLFSDDIEWVHHNLKINFPSVFISHDCPAYEDMRLMSTCKHHIIANSSFSWWGAWLNPSKQKLVIAPKKWVNDALIDTSSIIPELWTTL